MHAGNFIELATDLSFNLRNVTHSTGAEMIRSEEFWQTSKEKLEHWNKVLKVFATDLVDPQENHDPWTAISCVINEILCSEFFSRITGALFVHKDNEFNQTVNGPIARAVFLFHLEARMRALEIIQIGLERGVAEAVELNGLRCKLERWCDLLLAFFPAQVSAEFSFESNRNKEFGRDIGEESNESKVAVQRLLRMAIRDYGRRLSRNPAANPVLNRRQFDLFSFGESSSSPVVSSGIPFETQSVNDLATDAERWIEDYLTVG